MKASKGIKTPSLKYEPFKSRAANLKLVGNQGKNYKISVFLMMVKHGSPMGPYILYSFVITQLPPLHVFFYIHP